MPSPNWRKHRYLAVVVAILLAAGVGLPGPGPLTGRMTKYETRYYVIHTDLGLEGAHEAAVRMTAIVTEYRRRTKGFAGKITKKLPFYLYRNAWDYYAAGGRVGTIGLFSGDKLMAVAGKETSAETWHTVQHEAFHQFADSVICGDIPVWVNEGMAEYFGEGIFTGDGFVMGMVPPERLKRLKEGIKKNRLRALSQFMKMSYEQWSREMSITHYDQAWSMIHFLVHADNGRYVKPLNGFMNDIGLRQMQYRQAWMRNFGKDIAGFQKRYCQWWLAQPDDPTRRLYDQAVVATMTSFFARACLKGQKFETADEFLAAAKAGKLEIHKKLWLPPRLLAENLPRAEALGRWTIERPPKALPQLICTLADGHKFIGTCRPAGPAELKVTVWLVKPGDSTQPAPTSRNGTTQPALTSAPATASAPPTQPSHSDPLKAAIALAHLYIDTGMTDKAREILIEALKNHPDSPHRPEAEELLANLR